LIICGPSGVGKGTLVNYLLTLFPQHFQLSVSHTTRPPRSHETHGHHYFFVTPDEFQAGITQNEFIEYAQIHGKHYYGTSTRQLSGIQDKGKIGILEVDIKGALALKQKLKPNHSNNNNNNNNNKEARYLFISTTGGYHALSQRLTGRGTETPEQIAQRLNTAEREFNFLGENPDFFDFVLFNDDLDKSKATLVEALKKWYLCLD